jgi:hypothetical protein
MLPTHAETLRADADWWALGSGDGVSIDERGRLTPARNLTRTVVLDAGAVWDLALFEDTLWSAWSEPGRLMKLQGDELETVVTLDNDRWISAVTADAGGEPWYAISPGGILQNGVEVGAEYIWDLLSLKDGGLLIATGEPGFVGLWDGKLSTILSFPEQESARTLAQGASGTVWIGTAVTGQIWHWDRKTEPFLIGQLPKREVVSLAADENGGIWILHTKSSADLKAEKPEPPVPNGDRSKKKAEPKDARDAVLSHWSPSAGFREIWQQAGEIPYAMFREGEDLWIGSGPGGGLRRISANGRVLEGYTLPVKNVSALAIGVDGGLAIGGSGDGMLAGLLPSRRTEAVWSGPVIDAGAPAHWGRVDATVEGNAHLEVRVGNIEAPDTGWTAWTPIDSGSATVLPVARYGQLRVQFVSGKKRTAAVSEVTWIHTPRNRAPRIRELRAEPVGTIWFSGPSPSRNSGGPVVIGDPIATESAKRLKPNPRTNVKKAYEPGTQTVVWTAEDADGDSLRASLTLIAADGRKLLLNEGASLGFHAFDVRALPEGEYLVELTVEDPQGAEESRQGASFTVDRTAPSIEAKRTTTGWRLIVRDAVGLRSVDRREGERWLPILPRDGIVDGREEFFELTEMEGDGPVWIRVVDRSGNVYGSWIGGARSGVSAARSASIE